MALEPSGAATAVAAVAAVAAAAMAAVAAVAAVAATSLTAATTAAATVVAVAAVAAAAHHHQPRGSECLALVGRAKRWRVAALPRRSPASVLVMSAPALRVRCAARAGAAVITAIRAARGAAARAVASSARGAGVDGQRAVPSPLDESPFTFVAVSERLEGSVIRFPPFSDEHSAYVMVLQPSEM